MLRAVKLLVPLAALAFAGAWSYNAQAEDKAEGGTVNVSVVDKDGAAVADAAVRINKAPKKAEKPDRIGKPEGNGKREKAEGRAEGGATPKEKPAKTLTEGKADKDGKFAFNNIPAGQYVVVAAVRGKGMGKSDVTVEAGQTVDVTVTLEAPKAGRGDREGNPGQKREGDNPGQKREGKPDGAGRGEREGGHGDGH